MPDTGLTLTAANPGAVNAGRTEDTQLQQRAALEKFLAGVERRALRMARFAVRHDDDAMDIVQDAMLKLVRRYAAAPEPELPLLFFRILRNAIIDHQRRAGMRRRWLAFTGQVEDDAADPVSLAAGAEADNPAKQLVLDHAMQALEAAVTELPQRQQQVFLLRTLEGLDVAATAAVMGCSTGSVKTHYFRALQRLRTVLGDHWP